MRIRLNYQFAHQIPRAFALLPHTERNNQRRDSLDEEANIEAWLYDPSAQGQQHAGLDWFLEQSADCADVSVDDYLMLRKVGVAKKLEKIGRLNRKIVELIDCFGASGLSAKAISSPNRLRQEQKSKTYLASYYNHLNGSQLHQRLIYLNSVGLVDVSDESDGVTFRLAADVAKLFDGDTVEMGNPRSKTRKQGE